MKRFFESVLPVVTLLCAVGSWLGFPRLGFLAGCAAGLSVRVPGDRFFWLILILPLPALLLLFLSLKHSRFCCSALPQWQTFIGSTISAKSRLWKYPPASTVLITQPADAGF